MNLLIVLAALVLNPAAGIDASDGAACRTYVAGEPAGPRGTVVLVPGLTGCAYGFRHVAEQLGAAGCRVVLVEPLGVGASDRPADADYSLTAQADRLAAAMTVHGTGRSVVVAHGVAASMALRLAYRHPRLVGAVVSIEGGPDENSLTPTVEKALGLVAIAAKLGAKRAIRDRLQSSLEAASGDRTWIDGITVRRYYQGPGRDISATVDALRGMASAEEPESLRMNLNRITCPVLVMLGAAEHKGRPSSESIALLQSSLSDCRIKEVAGAGHFIFEEQPAAVSDEILRLLDETGAAATGDDVAATAATTGGGSCVR